MKTRAMIDDRAGHLRFALILFLPLVAAGIALPGCSGSSDELPRQPIAGRVLLDGKPLSHGTIMLYPVEMSTKEHERVASGNTIVNGWFWIPRDKGPVPGNYKIAVSSEKVLQHPDRKDRDDSPAEVHAPAVETIPARFNAKTELEVEIKEGGIKELRIDLQSS
jgi:hypothetical protein